jgi:hypothetical protein
MTDLDALDLLELAEAVASGRIPAVDAEQRIRSTPGPEGDRAENAVRELRSLIGAASAIRAHASATNETLAARSSSVVAGAFSGYESNVTAIPVGAAVRRRASGTRSARPPRRIGLLVAATLAIGTGVVAASVMGSRLIAPNPAPSEVPLVALVSPSAEPSPSAPAPTTLPSPTSSTFASPPPSDNPNANAPGVVIWNMSAANRIEVSTYRLAARNGLSGLFEVDTWPDPDRSAGTVINRQLLASPTGKLVAIAETDPRARTRIRVLTSKGAVVWSTESTNGVPALAWSADGSLLAVAFTPQPWFVVNFQADGSPNLSKYSPPTDVPLKLVGFSADGLRLLAYDGTGEAAPWESPYAIDLADGTVARLDQFAGGPSGIAVSNTTTLSGLVDPVTGRVLDSGDPSGRQTNWSLRQGSMSTELGVPVSNAKASIQPRWADDGSIVVLETSLDNDPPSLNQKDPTLGLIRQPAAGAEPGEIVKVTWSYMGPYGTRCKGVLLDVRHGWALVGLSGIPSSDDAWLGYDTLSLVNLGAQGRSGLMNLDGLGKRDIHVAGLIQ